MSFINFTGANTITKPDAPKYETHAKYGIAVTNQVLSFVENVGGPIAAPFTLTARLLLSISTSSTLTEEMIDTIKGYHQNLEEYTKVLNVFDHLVNNSGKVISYPGDIENLSNAIGNLISFLYGFMAYEDKKEKLSWKDSFKKMATRTVVAYTLDNIDSVVTSSMTRIVADMLSISNFMMMQLFALSSTNNELFLKLMEGVMEKYQNPEKLEKLDINDFYAQAKPQIEQAVQEISKELEEQMIETQKIEKEIETSGGQTEKLILPDTLDSEPNTTESIQPTAIQPTTTETVQPTAIQPTTTETIQPATTETIQPTTTETIQPTTTETIQPTTTETIQPATTETIQPATTETIQPATTETTETKQPTTTETIQPTTTETLSATTETIQPATTETIQPATTETIQPATTEIKPLPETLKPLNEKETKPEPLTTEKTITPDNVIKGGRRQSKRKTNNKTKPKRKKWIKNMFSRKRQ
jgi:hypothetical protein